MQNSNLECVLTDLFPRFSAMMILSHPCALFSFRKSRRLRESCASWERLWERPRRGQKHWRQRETLHSSSSTLLKRSVQKDQCEISKPNVNSSCLQCHKSQSSHLYIVGHKLIMNSVSICFSSQSIFTSFGCYLFVHASSVSATYRLRGHYWVKWRRWIRGLAALCRPTVKCRSSWATLAVTRARPPWSVDHIWFHHPIQS